MKILYRLKFVLGGVATSAAVITEIFPNKRFTIAKYFLKLYPDRRFQIELIN